MNGGIVDVFNDECFKGCPKLKTVDGHIKAIGLNAFDGCESLETVITYDDLSQVRGEAFANCPNLKTVILAMPLKDYKDGNAFKGSENIEEISIPHKVNRLLFSELKDCKNHLKLDKVNKKTGKPEGDDTMIFLTEGQSAGGTLGLARDTMTQAVFFLKGKPLNTCGLNKDVLYKNEEFFNLIKTLDIEETLDHLRYSKIIFATDADVDGLHIRMLLTTFFMRFYRQLISDGRVFILETPLFRVRNKKEHYFCYTDQEREAAIRKCGKGCEITRFKGLGEIDKDDFKGFIGKDIRLTPVTCSDDIDVEKTIKFYMGQNTPERKDYIMENLVCDSSEF